MQAAEDEHVGMAYEELTEMVDEFFAQVEQFLAEDDEIDAETVLRFVAALIYENNVRIRHDIDAGRVHPSPSDE